MILLTGATGYVGGRLLTALQTAGREVRCLSRHPEHLVSRTRGSTTTFTGDVHDLGSLRKALKGVRTAFYLVHSMQDGRDFESLERKGAELFAQAARENKVERIIFLGGLGEDGSPLSAHLRSRHEVGRILSRFGGVCLELRASIVIGSGSISFEMVRALVERLPVMITPRWVRTPTQPISVGNLISVLVQSIDFPLGKSTVLEIGGRERTSYGGIMQEYARQRRLTRFMIPVPLLTPHLSGLWLGLVTPVYARIGRTLVKSMENPTVVKENAVETIFRMVPDDVAESIHAALRNEDHEMAETRWCDAVSSAQVEGIWGGERFGTRIVDSRSFNSQSPLERCFDPIRRLGGNEGWYFANSLWWLRGALDLLLGGVGMRRGRRHPTDIHVGDVIDFWRVENFEPNRLLRLRAEMKLPGRAWLQFEVNQTGDTVRVTQTAIFDPLGTAGLFYWYFLYPIHSLIFTGMLKGIQTRIEKSG